VPVITGIGHATDTTIADSAADVCAPTPSAAAELVTAAQFGVGERVERMSARLQRAGRYEVLRARQRLAGLGAEMALRRVVDGLRRREQRLDDLGYRAETSALRLVRVRRERLARLEKRLGQQHVMLRLADDRQHLQGLRARLEAARLSVVAKGRKRVEQATTQLEALSPLRVLERGYALVYGSNGKLLRASNEVSEGESVVAQLAKGRVRATVTSAE
jgi:exodeoxyribonuclease VII large subunit